MDSYPAGPEGDVFAMAQDMIGKYATVPVAPAPTYKVYKGHDAACSDCDIAHTWTTDVAQLMVLCNLDPGCVGFVSTGYLKDSVRTLAPNPISDLYVKVV